MTPDSRPDTYAHILEVQRRVSAIASDLIGRMLRHDASKLVDPEKKIFDEFSPKLAKTPYNSPEYNGQLAEMQIALDHHYWFNDHHPQHFRGLQADVVDQGIPRTAQVQGNIPIPEGAGIHGMNLIQMLEMLADWKAATLRHEDGDLRKSITVNAERFGYGKEIHDLLLYTAAYLGWL